MRSSRLYRSGEGADDKLMRKTVTFQRALNKGNELLHVDISQGLLNVLLADVCAL